MSTKFRLLLASAVVAVLAAAATLLSPGRPGVATIPAGGASATAEAPRPEVGPPGDVFRICRYSEDGRSWDRSGAVRVRLDADRLRVQGLDRTSVMRAMLETGLVPAPLIEVPPPGVVLVHRLGRPDQYGEIILKANPEGDLVRLKDVAAVEAGW